ncbi:MAG TPA: hypothetical protein VJ987_12070 [Anaerolineales bacterium]|nr:hypothetical protein [Anaerolineales bacterium]
MITPTIEPHHFDREARRIRKKVSTILTRRGLLPRFKRWRLTQDPDTGMIVLFGILNNRYIAKHTSIPFSDYFDPGLLNDLANEMQLQVVACNSDGLRYAIILDRGSLGKLPTHIDFPFVDEDKLFARVVYDDKPLVEALQPQIAPSRTVAANVVDDHALVHQGVGAFLKVFDDIKLRDDLAQDPAQNPPKIVVIDEGEFNKRVAEHEANRQRHKRIRKLFDNDTQEKLL